MARVTGWGHWIWINVDWQGDGTEEGSQVKLGEVEQDFGWQYQSYLCLTVVVIDPLQAMRSLLVYQ